MASKFFALLTERGAVKLAAATALGNQVKITQMAVGDGNGTLPTPTASQTALVNEKRRAALNSLTIDPANPSQIIAEQVIPEGDGGFWIREVGVYDDAGELIAVANCAETYKPVLAEGSGRTQVIRMVLIVSSTESVTLKIDPSVVLATRKYVDDKVIEIKVYVDDLMAKHLAAADPHSQYALKASPTFTGTPKAPTPPTNNNSTQLATTAFVQAVIAQLVASSPAALDTLNELAAALGNDPNFATTITNALALKAPLASPALTGVPTAPTAGATINTTQIATTAFVQAVITALKAGAPTTLDTLDELAAAINDDPNFATTINGYLALKAPLSSPALTGIPTAPTAVSTVNNTQVATTAFVQAAIARLVASSPEALDTLNELAAALGNDPNFATTITNALALKAPLASPALTGVPTAPTAGATVNTTQVATTAFVQTVITALKAGAPTTLDTLNELAAAINDDPNFATTMTNALALKASLASPALTGIPTAPTAGATVNTTQLATTAFVQAVITALKAGAPTTLDTLNELAAAINDDPNFATTMTNALALKAPLVSPDLTGTPTAPTAAIATNTTQIATTAFVKAAIANLVASAPGALDTLKELAAALGNDASFATTMTNALAGKQPLDSTLTTLSGKNAAEILQYLGLGTLSNSVFPSRITLPGGWKIMFGIATASSTTGAAKLVTFPEAFSIAAAPVIVVTPNNASNAATSAWYDNQTTTGFNLRCSAVVSCTWIAIG